MIAKTRAKDEDRQELLKQMGTFKTVRPNRREDPLSFLLPLNCDSYTSSAIDVPTKGNQLCGIKGLGVHTGGAYQMVKVS